MIAGTPPPWPTKPHNHLSRCLGTLKAAYTSAWCYKECAVGRAQRRNNEQTVDIMPGCMLCSHACQSACLTCPQGQHVWCHRDERMQVVAAVRVQHTLHSQHNTGSCHHDIESMCMTVETHVFNNTQVNQQPQHSTVSSATTPLTVCNLGKHTMNSHAPAANTPPQSTPHPVNMALQQVMKLHKTSTAKLVVCPTFGLPVVPLV